MFSQPALPEQEPVRPCWPGRRPAAHAGGGYQYAVVYKDMLKDPLTRNLILGSMVSFLAILFVGYIYTVKKRAFDWKN